MYYTDYYLAIIVYLFFVVLSPKTNHFSLILLSMNYIQNENFPVKTARHDTITSKFTERVKFSFQGETNIFVFCVELFCFLKAWYHKMPRPQSIPTIFIHQAVQNPTMNYGMFSNSQQQMC